MQPGLPAADLAALRSQVARLEQHATTEHTTAQPGAGRIGFGAARIDLALPGGGVAAGALHEVAGAGPQAEHGTAAALLAAGLLARVPATSCGFWSSAIFTRRPSRRSA